MTRTSARKRTNLRDVAAHAGVSVATVSRVLNAPKSVAPKTRARVESSIDALRFVPSAAARAINRGSSGFVAALIPTIDNAIYARVIDGLEAGLADQELALMVAQTGDDAEAELTRARQLVHLGAEALIVVGADHAPGLYDLMDRAQIPVVAVSHFDANAPIPTIGYDNHSAALQAAEHLEQLGHTRVAVLHGPVSTNDRMRIRKQALMGRQDTARFRFFEVPISVEGGHTGTARLLDAAHDVTAVLCFSDVIAMGALNALHGAGISVPQDMSLMGMEDLPAAQYTHPPLTSVSLSVEDMGVRAASAVSQWLRDGTQPAPLRLGSRVIARKTTAPPV